jgi:hypothetical protein
MNPSLRMAAVFGFVLAVAAPAQATPVYVTASFSGGISTVKAAGNALGLQRAYSCSGCAAGSVAGDLLFDQSLVPAGGSGFLNVPLGSPAGATNDLIFDSVFGSAPLEFQFGDASIQGGPSIQFKNGVFNGFYFVEDFSLNGKSFELNMQRRSWNIKALNNGFYTDLAAAGYLNIGNAALTHQQTFEPFTQLRANSDPEPAALALLCLGVLGISATCRRKVNSYQHFINTFPRA